VLTHVKIYLLFWV